jgi:sulfur relay (sulfurtransferase) DsrF/TusC family protein
MLEDGVEIAQIDDGVFEAEPGSSPEEIGAQVARSLYGGLR